MLVITDSKGNKLEITSHHPVFVEEKGFIKAGQVEIGNTLKTTSGFSKVTSNKEISFHGDVFNISVDNMNISNDSFYASNILVGGVNMQQSLDK